MTLWQDAQGNIHDDDNGRALTLPTWPQSLTKYMGTYPLPPTASQQWAAYQAQAKTALEASDVTMHRILESIILGNTTTWTADEQAFVNWRRALRAILSQTQPATIPTALPVRPPYPTGT